MTDTTPHTIDSAEARRLLSADPNVRIIDVRTGGEFESVHIPGSYNVPLDILGEHAGELAQLDDPVVLVCQSGARAEIANTTLSAAGKHHVQLLDGGIEAWQATGGAVNRGETQKWALDRQVRLVAGSISLVGILASTVIPQAKWLAGGVATGLTFSAVSNTCAMGNLLSRLPYNQSTNSDIDTVMAALGTANLPTDEIRATDP